ncbi:MAG: methyltransferase domain-containing protein [Rhodocyclaceae bacterium]|nr:methyltransferase domain-containing protein [Rhodocyclaceae bacterium]
MAGGRHLEICALLDRQQYFDPQGTAEAAGISPAGWPLFGQIWPSARKLADLMEDWEIGAHRVLEVGCGLGLASLVIHRRIGNITASDCHPEVEAFLRTNLALNGLPAIKYATGNWKRTNPDLGKFDLIIGSDVLYERAHAWQLAGFIDQHAAPTAEVLIIDPNRGNRVSFNRLMAGCGFDLNQTVINTPLSDGSPYKGRLLHYCRAFPG